MNRYVWVFDLRIDRRVVTIVALEKKIFFFIMCKLSEFKLSLASPITVNRRGYVKDFSKPRLQVIIKALLSHRKCRIKITATIYVLR